ncbi:MAG: sensor histidine kinase [Halopenitus sp.]
MGDRVSDLGLLSVGVLGTLLGLIHVHHLLSLDSASPLWLFEALLPLALAIGLIAGSAWLTREEFTRRETGRVLLWVLVGCAGLLVTMGWTLGHELLRGEPIEHFWYIVADNLTAGAIVGLVLGAYDVEGDRRTEAYETASHRIQRERNRFATLFENVPSPTVYYELVDDDPVVLDANPAFESKFGYDADAIVGESVDDLIVPPNLRDEADELNERVGVEDLQVEVTRSTVDGQGDFLLYTVPLSAEENRGFATYVDLTEQKRREQRLSVLNRVLRHDLRNAMNVVVGHADTLAAGDEDPEAAADAIRDRAEELLEKSRKARIVERVLDADPGHDRAVDLATVVAERVERARNQHPDLALEVSLSDEPAWACANDLLGVAIDNLLENAASHGGEDPKARVSVDPNDPHTLRVFDNGPGIPETEIDVLRRERETQLEHTSGLGLWLVAWVVRDAGGAIDIQNHDNGAEVTITLPAVDPPSDESDE